MGLADESTTIKSQTEIHHTLVKRNMRATSAHNKSDFIPEIIPPDELQSNPLLHPPSSSSQRVSLSTKPKPIKGPNTSTTTPTTIKVVKKSRNPPKLPPPPDTVAIYIPTRKIRKDPVERMNAFKLNYDEQVLEKFAEEPKLKEAAHLFDRRGASPNIHNHL